LGVERDPTEPPGGWVSESPRSSGRVDADVAGDNDDDGGDGDFADADADEADDGVGEGDRVEIGVDPDDDDRVERGGGVHRREEEDDAPRTCVALASVSMLAERFDRPGLPSPRCSMRSLDGTTRARGRRRRFFVFDFCSGGTRSERRPSVVVKNVEGLQELAAKWRAPLRRRDSHSSANA
jgi:hypothetical protein